MNLKLSVVLIGRVWGGGEFNHYIMVLKFPHVTGILGIFGIEQFHIDNFISMPVKCWDPLQVPEAN